MGARIRAEALRPIVPTGGCCIVNQLEGWGNTIGGEPFLVEVHGDVGDQRLPLELHEHRRGGEGTGGGINHMALDSTVLADRVGLLAELDEVVLAGVALPAFDPYPRRIDAAGRDLRARQIRAGERPVLDSLKMR